MKYIEMRLTGKRGLTTKLDPEDYEKFKDEKWTVSGCAKPGVYYASKSQNIGKVDGKSRFKKRSLHKEILECPPGMEIDHINGDTLDNRKANLRLCTRNQNAQNRSRKRAPGKLKGAYFMKATSRWYSRIQTDGKDLFLGWFDNDVAAHAAYCDAADRLHGEFANHG